MHERTNRPHFIVEGHDFACDDPFVAADDALRNWCCRGDERPDAIQISLAKELIAPLHLRRIEELAYSLAEDMALEEELFHSAKEQLEERIKWAIKTCSTSAFATGWRYLTVRVVEVEADEEWDIHPEDFEKLKTWWGMEDALCRTMKRGGR